MAIGLKTASKWMHHRRERAKGWRRVCCHWLCVDSPFSEVPGDAALSPWFQSTLAPICKGGTIQRGITTHNFVLECQHWVTVRCQPSPRGGERGIAAYAPACATASATTSASFTSVGSVRSSTSKSTTSPLSRVARLCRRLARLAKWQDAAIASDGMWDTPNGNFLRRQYDYSCLLALAMLRTNAQCAFVRSY